MTDAIKRKNGGVVPLVAAGLAGVASGVALGFLYSPSSGRRNREYVKERARRVKDGGDRMVNKAKGMVKRSKEEAIGTTPV